MASSYRNTASEAMMRADTAPASALRRNDESWVEIASQPSSSSLSSIDDEIVTTGLQVGNAAHPSRRRRLHDHHAYQQRATGPHNLQNVTTAQGTTSSQEEYDETESEEMTSSIENIATSPTLVSATPSSLPPRVKEEDDDENATMVGKAIEFRPQPNAFSHPRPSMSRPRAQSSTTTYQAGRPSMGQRSQTRSYSRRSHDPFSPAYQADTDAALQASLTTLLSCAAAARGLPKPEEDRRAGQSSGSPVLGARRTPALDLRLVPESELDAETPVHPLLRMPLQPPQLSRHATAATSSNGSAPSAPKPPPSPPGEKLKRAAPGRTRSPQRATKKKRTSATVASDADTTAAFISPTMMGWVISAGVIVLFSVVGFGAGYVIGREVGRSEVGFEFAGGGSDASAAYNASSCGQEVARSTGSLRRFRWSTAVGRTVVA